jgi:alpha-tubulin suppressor-like RCC1 family protein
VTRTLATSVVLCGALALAGCNDNSQNPIAPQRPNAAQLPSDRAAREAQINGLINALYASKDQGKVFAAFAKIKGQLASGSSADVQQQIVAFVGMLLTDFQNGALQDPNGAQPPSIPDALRDLVNSVAQFGGFPPFIPSANAFTTDGVVAVVGAAGGTIKTPAGFAGVRFPAGALPSDVVLVVSRLENPQQLGQGPLPTTFDQYPLFYDFSTFPVVPQFGQPVTVGLCRLEVGDPFGPATETIADRLQLAHPDPADPATIELLPHADASFIQCTGVSLASADDIHQGRSGVGRALHALASAGSRVASFFAPTPAYAVHGGLGGLTSSFSPFGAVDPGRLHFASVTVGESHSCALTTSGRAWCWGDNAGGELGDGTTTTRLVPTEVQTTLKFTQLSVHNAFSCGLATDSRAYCWGTNGLGQLGDGTTQPHLTPAPVAGGLAFVEIGAGSSEACGRTANGEIWCWGGNQQNQLGVVTTSTCQVGANLIPCSTVPLRAGGNMTFTSLSVGFWGVCGLSNAQAWCWGVLQSTQNITATPTLAPGGMTLSSINDGSLYWCGLDPAQHAWCSGLNVSGELGDGTTTSQTAPVAVTGGLAFASIATKNKNNIQDTTCGITATGDAYCWGSDAFGEMGAPAPNTCALNANNHYPCALNPSHLFGQEHYRQISIGSIHTCGVTTTDAVYCWGSGLLGRLGNGSTSSQSVPTPSVRSF